MTSTHRIDRIATFAAVTTAGFLGFIFSVWLHRSVKDHGWEGTLRYIWEGDFYSSGVRDILDMLDELETQVAIQVSIAELIETSFDRAKLDSVDDDQSQVKKQEWNNAHPGNLEKDITKLSYDLDKLAAKIDSVRPIHTDIKTRKKLLSNRVVRVMERVDVLLGLYQQS